MTVAAGSPLAWPDGKRFAIEKPEASEQKSQAQATLLFNFFDELRRRAPAGGK